MHSVCVCVCLLEWGGWGTDVPLCTAAEVVMMHGSHLDAVEMGCSECEILQCDGTVGYGGR